MGHSRGQMSRLLQCPLLIICCCTFSSCSAFVGQAMLGTSEWCSLLACAQCCYHLRLVALRSIKTLILLFCILSVYIVL